jgi:photosystem II stability/assembly factor-like uncharacterized protein
MLGHRSGSAVLIQTPAISTPSGALNDLLQAQTEGALSTDNQPKIPSALAACQETFRSLVRTVESTVGSAGVGEMLRSDRELQKRVKRCQPTDLTVEFFHGMAFVGTQLGWVVGWHGRGGRILHTRDGGANWTVQHTSPKTFLEGVDFVNEKTGYAVGYDGTVLRTSDGGLHWSATAKAGRGDLTSVSCTGPRTCWVSGLTNGVVLATSDAGATWSEEKTPSFSMITSLQFIDATTGWAATGGGEVLGRPMAVEPGKSSCRCPARSSGPRTSSMRRQAGR